MKRILSFLLAIALVFALPFPSLATGEKTCLLPYKVDGNDVIYNGVRYLGLVESVHNVNNLCADEALITFIVMTFFPSDGVTTVETFGVADPENPGNDLPVARDLESGVAGECPLMYQVIKEYTDVVPNWCVYVNDSTHEYNNATYYGGSVCSFVDRCYGNFVFDGRTVYTMDF